MARRAHIRIATIDTIYGECAPAIGYNQKNSYLEDRIEATNSYFNHLDDLNNKGADMEKVKKQLFKLNREIRKREAEGLERRDPVDFLDEMIAEEEAKLAKNARGPNSADDSDIASPLSVEPASPLKTAQPTAKQLEEKLE